jgi:uncharacterized protein DUF4332
MIGVTALLVFVAATLALIRGIEPVPTWYFHLAWWPYIVGLDDLNRRRGGASLLRDRPLRFLALCAVSVASWSLFEAANLRLGNWYYVMQEPERWIRWTGGVVAFATVLPGILVTLAWIENAGWLRNVPVRPMAWGRRQDRVLLTVGLICLVAPLVWPDVFFALIWGTLALLLEPWNRRHAARSFLRDLQAGQAGPLARTLLAGLVCGVLWELWNFWARTKWIYTVPGVGTLKLFEMPVLGFLGFPPFAVECLVLVRFLSAAWTKGLVYGERTRRGLAAGLALLAAVLTLAVFSAERITVDSFYVPVSRLDVLPPLSRQRLVTAGLERPEEVLEALRSTEERRAWAERTGLTEAALSEAYDRVGLVMFRGVGADRARELEVVGIRRRADLLASSPDALAAALRAAAPSGAPRDPFLERRVRAWLQGTRARTAEGR